MIERGYRDVRPFGQRGAADPGGRAADPGRERRDVAAVPDRDAPVKTTGALAWALRTVALAGFAAIFATQYLARIGLPEEVATTRIARGDRTGSADPETTGSIGRPGIRGPASPRPAPATPIAAAQATQLDPCAVAGTGRARP